MSEHSKTAPQNGTMPEPEPTPKRSKKRFLKYVLLIPLLLIFFIALRFKLDGNIDYDVSTAGITIPTFTEQEIEFTHKYKKETAIQTTGGAIINIDNQGAEELFLGGGEGQPDAIFSIYQWFI